MADDFGYHIDHHGSLVRPPRLLAARAAGLSGEELAAVTDEAVVALAHALRPAARGSPSSWSSRASRTSR